MTAIRARSLVAQVYDKVLRRIGSGGAAPGAALGIAELARDLGVSPTPVREALQRLRAEGHLLYVENIGYRLPEPPTSQQYTDWAVARIVVESSALLYILGPIDTRLLDEAQAINAEIRATDFGTSQAGVRKFSELNWRFHAKLLALARNPLLDEVHTRLYAAPQFSRIFLGRGILHQAEVVAEHDKVLDQLRRGDRVAAAGAQREHIVESLERDARLSDLSISLKRLTTQ
jgi:DNA-binding GntR family transcriptional regulator